MTMKIMCTFKYTQLLLYITEGYTIFKLGMGGGGGGRGTVSVVQKGWVYSLDGSQLTGEQKLSWGTLKRGT